MAWISTLDEANDVKLKAAEAELWIGGDDSTVKATQSYQLYDLDNQYIAANVVDIDILGEKKSSCSMFMHTTAAVDTEDFCSSAKLPVICTYTEGGSERCGPPKFICCTLPHFKAH